VLQLAPPPIYPNGECHSPSGKAVGCIGRAPTVRSIDFRAFRGRFCQVVAHTGRHRPCLRQRHHPLNLSDKRIEDAMTRTTMKFAIAAALMSTLGTAPAAEAQPVNRYKGNGAWLSVSGYDSSGCRSFFVLVSRGGTNAAPQTVLYYDIYDYCAGTWAATGSGTIPNTDLKISGKTVTLKTTGADSATFSSEGDAPIISLTLTKNGSYSESWSGHSRVEYFGTTVQRHGSWTSASVSVSGTIGGSAISAAWGDTGTGREHYIEFERARK
jgi:hypothetical protein